MVFKSSQAGVTAKLAAKNPPPKNENDPSSVKDWILSIVPSLESGSTQSAEDTDVILTFRWGSTEPDVLAEALPMTSYLWAFPDYGFTPTGNDVNKYAYLVQFYYKYYATIKPYEDLPQNASKIGNPNPKSSAQVKEELDQIETIYKASAGHASWRFLQSLALRIMELILVYVTGQSPGEDMRDNEGRKRLTEGVRDLFSQQRAIHDEVLGKILSAEDLLKLRSGNKLSRDELLRMRDLVRNWKMPTYQRGMRMPTRGRFPVPRK